MQLKMLLNKRIMTPEILIRVSFTLQDIYVRGDRFESTPS